MWGAVLAVSWLYVRRARHPRRKPTTAYATFAVWLTSITLASFVLWWWIAERAELFHGHASTGNVIAVGVMSATPAFLVARYRIRRAPPLIRDLVKRHKSR